MRRTLGVSTLPVSLICAFISTTRTSKGRDVPGVDAIYEVLFSEMANLAARFLPSVPLYTLRDDKGFKQEYAKKFNLGGSQKQNAGAHVRLTNDSCFCSNRLPLTLS